MRTLRTFCGAALLALLVGCSSGGDEDTLHRTQRARVQNRNRSGADISCLAASYTTRLEQLNSDFSLWNSWTGTYAGPFGENQFPISQSAPPNSGRRSCPLSARLSRE